MHKDTHTEGVNSCYGISDICLGLEKLHVQRLLLKIWPKLSLKVKNEQQQNTDWACVRKKKKKNQSGNIQGISQNCDILADSTSAMATSPPECIKNPEAFIHILK